MEYRDIDEMKRKAHVFSFNFGNLILIFLLLSIILFVEYATKTTFPRLFMGIYGYICGYFLPIISYSALYFINPKDIKKDETNNDSKN